MKKNFVGPDVRSGKGLAPLVSIQVSDAAEMVHRAHVEDVEASNVDKVLLEQQCTLLALSAIVQGIIQLNLVKVC